MEWAELSPIATWHSESIACDVLVNRARFSKLNENDGSETLSKRGLLVLLVACFSLDWTQLLQLLHVVNCGDQVRIDSMEVVQQAHNTFATCMDEVAWWSLLCQPLHR